MTSLMRYLLAGWLALAVLAPGAAPGQAPAGAGDAAPAPEEPTLTPDEYIARARDHMQNGRNIEAIGALKKALDQRPVDATARLMASEAYLRIGNGEAAEREAVAAFRNRGVPSRVIPAIGRAFLFQGKYQDLLTQIQPRNMPSWAAAQILFLRGQAYFARMEFAPAETAFKTALERDPENKAAKLGLARLALARETAEIAKPLAETALAADPQNPDAWFVRAEADRRLGKAEDAAEGYARALKLAPKHIPAAVAHGAVLLSLGRDEPALEVLDTARQIMPGDPQIGILRALALSRAGREAEARTALLKTAAAVDQMEAASLTNNPASILLAAVVRFATGDLEPAYLLFTRYSGLVPDNLKARKILGTIQLSRFDHRRAIDSLLPLAAAIPNDPEIFAFLGSAYLGRSAYAEAAGAFASAAALNPRDANIQTHLALSRLGMGNRRGAARELARAFALHDQEWRTGMMLGLLQVRLGRNEEAAGIASILQAASPRSPLPPNLEGIARLRADQPALARASFEAALRLDTSYLPALYNLASLDISGGDLATARRRYVAILKIVPDELEALMGMARLAEADGRVDEALRWLVKAIEATPRDPAPGLARVALLLRNRRTAEALSAVTTLNSAHPRNALAQELSARVHLAAGDRGEAIAAFRHLANTGASSIAHLLRIARQQERLGDFDGAIFSLESALSIEPANTGLKDAVIELEVMRRPRATAEQYLAGFKDQTGQKAAVLSAFGALLLRENEPLRAAAVFNEALKIRPDRRILFRLHHALSKAGRGEDAFKVLKGWMARNPKDLESARFLAARLSETGALKDAQGVLKWLSDRQPEDAEILNDLAWVSHKLKDRRARALAEKALTLAPGEPAILDTLGWILVENGKVEDGLARLRVASAKAPGDPRISFHRAVALSQLGLAKDARRAVEHALASNIDFVERPLARKLLARLVGG